MLVFGVLKAIEKEHFPVVSRDSSAVYIRDIERDMDFFW
jgi:hypothetical protein